MLAALGEINRMLAGAFLVTQHHVSRPVTRADLALTGEAPPITCPSCGFTSHHPMDAREGYCGRCHEWHSRAKILDAAKVLHDQRCNPCPHDRKYLHCCANFVNAILEQGGSSPR